MIKGKNLLDNVEEFSENGVSPTLSSNFLEVDIESQPLEREPVEPIEDEEFTF